MADPHRVTVRMSVDGEVISGVVSDDRGESRPFRGWLELIAAVHATGRSHGPARTAPAGSSDALAEPARRPIDRPEGNEVDA